MIDRRNVFDQPKENDQITYDNIQNIATGQGHDPTTGCLLAYLYFKEHYKLISTDLSKPQKLNADTKTIQQINFTGNLDPAGNTILFLLL